MSGVKPAMSAEEWEGHLSSGEPFDYFESNYAEQMPGHKAAALALDGQPFGFTRDDVKQLRGLVAMFSPPEHNFSVYNEAVEPLSDLADRIEALLPPEGE